MHVGRSDGLRLQLGGLSVLLFNALDLLLLYLNWGNVHSQDNVFDLRLGEAGHVDVVLLGVVSQNQVLQLNLHLDPLLISQSWPDVVRLRHYRLFRHKYHLCPLGVDIECPENQDQPGERSE